MEEYEARTCDLDPASERLAICELCPLKKGLGIPEPPCVHWPV